MTPKERALAACVAAALRAGGRPFSIHEYARESGVSARMLIHHFGTKVGLDRAVVGAVDDGLRAQAQDLAEMLGGLTAVDQLISGFRAPESAQIRSLFRILLARAFSGEAGAVAALAEERRRWQELFEGVLASPAEAARTVVLLQGAALDAILDDMLAG